MWYNSASATRRELRRPGRNDILPAVTNLFVGHNRMHDFSYFLGFTETNYNAAARQLREHRAGAVPPAVRTTPSWATSRPAPSTGGAPSYEGRDNANQITLNDGIPPITNQYLFQPIAGAFYSPCVDGDMDTSVFGHEYTHLISNRMVGGPDSGPHRRSGRRDGRVVVRPRRDGVPARERLRADDGANPWAVGAYATGNKNVGIRDYAINYNPLNYSDVGFDTPGAEVHADGEIWNGANYDVRQALVDKYNATYPSTDAACRSAARTASTPRRRMPGQPALDPARLRRVAARSAGRRACSTRGMRTSRPT